MSQSGEAQSGVSQSGRGADARAEGPLVLAGGMDWVVDGGLGGVVATGTDVVVLPTAAAFDGAGPASAPVLGAVAALGASATVVEVLGRHDAERAEPAARCARAGCVVLVGESPLHLRSAMQATPVWEAVLQAWRGGAALVGVGWAGAALGDPMVDPRGGALTLGLGVVPVSFLPHADRWGADRMRRTLKMAKGLLVAVDSGAAAVWTGASGWAGSSGVHGYDAGATRPVSGFPAPSAS